MSIEMTSITRTGTNQRIGLSLRISKMCVTPLGHATITYLVTGSDVLEDVQLWTYQ